MTPVSDAGLKAMAKILCQCSGDEFHIAEEALFQLIKDRKLAKITQRLDAITKQPAHAAEKGE